MPTFHLIEDQGCPSKGIISAEIRQDSQKIAVIAAAQLQITVNRLAGFRDPSEVIAKGIIVKTTCDIDQWPTDILARKPVNLPAFSCKTANHQLLIDKDRGYRTGFHEIAQLPTDTVQLSHLGEQLVAYCLQQAIEHLDLLVSGFSYAARPMCADITVCDTRLRTPAHQKSACPNANLLNQVLHDQISTSSTVLGRLKPDYRELADIYSGVTTSVTLKYLGHYYEQRSR